MGRDLTRTATGGLRFRFQGTLSGSTDPPSWSGCHGEWASLSQAILWGQGLWEGLTASAKAREGDAVT